jgi:fructose-1,6-bisphosphatase II / sedoheptulose-1,7-bisphosphatase
MGGQMQGRLVYESDDQIERMGAMGHPGPMRCFSVEEMARGDVMFAATGVTHGANAACGAGQTMRSPIRS